MTGINEVRERLEKDAACPLTTYTTVCARADLRALLADHARLQSQVDLAAELLERLEEHVPAAPEKECRCHISPPCNDCVDWGDRRELDEDVRNFIAEHGKEVQP